ncbi:unnamed protein product [Moneuplotes crassus]|uniref:Uncharacterized protein n=1 Tax=Euplotes crassus TaxID=5936 RepID=A0AAD1XNN6_EUPCR|nr:unnamed protein product [Moneuplotes crassus]
MNYSSAYKTAPLRKPSNPTETRKIFHCTSLPSFPSLHPAYISHIHIYNIEKQVKIDQSSTIYGKYVTNSQNPQIVEANDSQGDRFGQPRSSSLRTPDFGSDRSKSRNDQFLSRNSSLTASNLREKILKKKSNSKSNSSMSRSDEHFRSLRDYEENKVPKEESFHGRERYLPRKIFPDKDHQRLKNLPVPSRTYLYKRESTTSSDARNQKPEGIRSYKEGKIEQLLGRLRKNNQEIAELICSRESLLRKLIQERNASKHLRRIGLYNLKKAQLEAISLELEVKIQKLLTPNSQATTNLPFPTE